MLMSLLLPIIVSAVLLFVMSSLSWVVLQFHKNDWVKMPNEDVLMDALRNANVPYGSYMFPGCESQAEAQSADYAAKYKKGPRGIISVLPEANMGQNLGLTFLYFLVTSFSIAYLASIALSPGAEFITVFRFFATAGLLTYLSAMVCHAIWFKSRIIGHVIESICFALIIGVVFALMWPKA